MVPRLPFDFQAMPLARLNGARDKTVEGHRHALSFSDETAHKSMFILTDCANLAFRDLRLSHGGANSPGADVFSVANSHHVAWDKCTFDYAGCSTSRCDESLHLASPSTFLTVSRCRFDAYSQNVNVKHGARLDNYGYDDRSARITFFENYFSNGHSREPKIDVGWVHMLNNVWVDEDDHSSYLCRSFVFFVPYLAQIAVVRADSSTGAHLYTRSRSLREISHQIAHLWVHLDVNVDTGEGTESTRGRARRARRRRPRSPRAARPRSRRRPRRRTPAATRGPRRPPRALDRTRARP